MKIFLSRVLQGAAVKCPKPFLRPSQKNPAYELNPAPFYWALVPAGHKAVWNSKAMATNTFIK